MDSVLSPAQRLVLAASLREAGAPPDQASITVDLSATACDRAIDTFLSVMDLAPSVAAKMTIVSIGAQLLESRLEHLQRSIEKIGGQMGATPSRVRIEL